MSYAIAVAYGRMRRFFAGDNPADIWEYPERDQWKDACLLAKAYVAERQDDDEEPVTSEWLQRVIEIENKIDHEFYVGYEDGSPVFSDGLIVFGADMGKVWVQGERYERVLLPNMPTRGHVRRLCAALGVSLIPV